MKRTPFRGVQQTLKPYAYKRSEHPLDVTACLLHNEPTSCRRAARLSAMRCVPAAKASLNRAMSRRRQTRNRVIYTCPGSLSLPSAGCFSPFPHGTGTLSVSYEYLALPDGPGGFTQDFTCPALLRIPLRRTSLRVRSSHALWPDFPDRSTRDAMCDSVVLLPP